MKIVSLFLVLALIFSCSLKRPQGSTEAEVLYKESIKLIEGEEFIAATEKLNLIKSKFPYSYYATHAELLLADILFNQKNYAEAAAAYILFKDFHPKHQRINYVTWKIAESYYNQVPSTFDRDLAPCVEAMKYYNELLEKFKDSDFSKDAQERITFCQGQLTSREKYIADFYYKTKDFSSAKFHYLDILENIQAEELRSHAMKRVVASSFFLKDQASCGTFFSKYKTSMSKVDLEEAEQFYNKCQKLDQEKR